jgi:uncharacterized protein (TIGR02001 family)
MHSKLFTSVALSGALLMASGLAQAQFSSTVTVASDYDFRGVSLSAKDPALQASLDYAWENGFSLGAWASNIDSGEDIDDDLELDLYFNYEYSLSDDAALTAGLTYYLYPSGDDTEDYPEAYVGFTYKDIAFKQWFTNDNFGLDETAYYSEVNYSLAINDNWSIPLHAGYAWGDFWEDLDAELLDYSIGVAYSNWNFDFTLKLTGTDASGDVKIEDDVFNNEPRFVLSVATTLPWGE